MENEQSLAVPDRPQPGNMLETIAAAVADPRMDVAKMERLLAMHREIVADQRKTEFMAAKARLQAKLPQIDKYGKGKNSKYAKLEDIDAIIRPLLAEEGFSFDFDEESHTEKTVTFIATLSHAEGHSEVKRLTVPIDAAAKNQQGNSVRPPIQDAGSTVSYARRYLIKMHLNIVEKDEDTDGESRKPITDEQAKDIEAILQELKMDRKRFLFFMGVGDVKEILACDMKKATNAFDVQRDALMKASK